MIRILMLSRDRSGLDPMSATSVRWKRLVTCGVELDVIVLSRETTTWNEKGISVTGTGGGRIRRLFRMCRLATQRSLFADLVTAQDPFELGWIATRVARRAKKRCEVQDHGGFFDGERADEPLWWIRSRMAWCVARHANAIRTVSVGIMNGVERGGSPGGGAGNLT